MADDGTTAIPATDRPRSGWDLITSRPLLPEQVERADAIARIEAEHKGGKAKGKSRRKGEGG